MTTPPCDEERDGLVRVWLREVESVEQIFIGPSGVPSVHLTVYPGRVTPDLYLASVVSGLLVSPGNRLLGKLGIWSFKVRGTGYYPASRARADLRVGARVRLVREPTNQYDSNAVAVHDNVGIGPLGYVNRVKARQLSRILDSGCGLDAMLLRSDPMVVLAAEPMLLAHLRACRYSRHLEGCGVPRV